MHKAKKESFFLTLDATDGICFRLTSIHVANAHTRAHTHTNMLPWSAQLTRFDVNVFDVNVRDALGRGQAFHLCVHGAATKPERNEFISNDAFEAKG